MYKIKRLSQIDDLEQKEFAQTLKDARDKMKSVEATTIAHLLMFMCTNDEIGDNSSHWSKEHFGFIDAMGGYDNFYSKVSYREAFPHFLGNETSGYQSTMTKIKNKLKKEVKNDVASKTLNLLENDLDTVKDLLTDFAKLADDAKNKKHAFLTSNDKDDIIKILVNLRSKYKL